MCMASRNNTPMGLGSGLETSLLLSAPRAIRRRPYTSVRRREETRLPLVSALFYCGIEREQDTEQRFELGERKDGGAVAQGPFRFLMDLHEQAINAHRHGRACQRRDE